MRIALKSPVNTPFEKVAQDFGKDLFIFLLPPKFIARLVVYDGSKPGSKVHIRFKFPLPSDWVSIIKSEDRTADKYVFVDEGEKLPFGLKRWRHIHTIQKETDNTTVIIDDMHFSTGMKLFDIIIYPVLFLSFSPRKKLYKKYFDR